MIRICADIRPSHIQGKVLAAALKEVFCPGGKKNEYVFPVEKRDILLSISGPVTGPLTGANGPRA
jgi:hypothetical protein